MIHGGRTPFGHQRLLNQIFSPKRPSSKAKTFSPFCASIRVLKFFLPRFVAPDSLCDAAVVLSSILPGVDEIVSQSHSRLYTQSPTVLEGRSELLSNSQSGLHT